MKYVINIISLIAKIIVLELAFALSTPAADKTQYFVHLSLNYVLHLISGNSISKN